MVVMQAVVLEVQWGRLLVLDLETRQQVLVNTSDARRFRAGEFVVIWYSGAMTNSIPPQITALGIVSAPQGEMPPLLPPGVRPCPSCPPAIRPPVFFPPVFFPPVVRPPHRPGGSRPPHRPGPGHRPR